MTPVLQCMPNLKIYFVIFQIISLKIRGVAYALNMVRVKKLLKNIVRSVIVYVLMVIVQKTIWVIFMPS